MIRKVLELVDPFALASHANVATAFAPTAAASSSAAEAATYGAYVGAGDWCF